MGENSAIQWTHHTFNPWIGCTKISAACDHCYAEATSLRRGWVEWGAGKPRYRTGASNWHKPVYWNKRAELEGERYRVFCASLADVFDAEVSEHWRNDLFCLILATPCLDWLLLTKRPQVAKKYFDTFKDIPENVWLGATVEDQNMARLRLPILLSIPARVHFLSCEPLLSSIDIPACGPLPKWPDWIIVGGESGPHQRPMNLEHARGLQRFCRNAKAAFFMKQLGGHPDARGEIDDFPADLRVRQFPR